MKIKFEKGKSIISPIKLIIGVLGVWVLGIVIGNFINIVTERYVVGEEQRNFWIVILYVVISGLIGVGLAMLISHITMGIVRDINININKIAEGDFTARIKPITKNPHINSAVENFNKMVNELNSVALLKNDFVSNFTHEFKTPIASIKGYAELLENSENLTEEQKEFVKIIVEESKNLSVLSETVMKLAKLDSQSELTSVKKFSLDGQLEDCVLLFDTALKEKGIEIELKTIPLRIQNDPYLVREIWVNLIANAIKYSKHGGKIYITLKREKNKVFVLIKDEGIGMSEETQKHIFDKFYQENKRDKNKGLGLGLSIVKRILEITGGTISVSSEMGKGTEFLVCFDLSK